MRSRLRLVGPLCLALLGCGRIGFDATASPHDAPTADAVATDGGAATYGDLTDPTRWSTFDASSKVAGASGFYGGVFDGRYLYLVPSYDGALDGIVVRYDTRAAFTDGAAWSSFDTTTVNTNARGFNGGAFDGRYLYLIPQENAAGPDGVVARYDTQAAFTSAGAWQTYDAGAQDTDARGFAGATFDGRYLYLLPYQNSTVARYDTAAAFSAVTSWSYFNLSPVTGPVPAYIGGVFDGRYLYLVPFIGGATTSGLVTRYDTTASFTAPAGWSTFDAETLTPLGRGFAGGSFDGRYLYLAPFLTLPGQPGGTMARYDTRATFTTATAWSTFDLTTVTPSAKGFIGSTFDGRYAYFAPTTTGTIARHDTQASLTDAAAWTTFDLLTIAPTASGFYGAVFDGRAVYLIPHTGSTVARFDARSPSALPALPAFFGSFL